ncbi:ATP-dependent Clp protease ATP-binding protein [Spirochaetia bacterium]|nr:ATP-dependent Clp protease ATP-binding protein [Spirochaetia bacterium]
MYRGLTQRAHHILATAAQEEARRFHSEQLLPEHIIIALIKEGLGAACKALLFFHVDLKDFALALENEIPPISGGKPVLSSISMGAAFFSNVPPSARTRLLLKNADEEARNMDSDTIGTEHILFAAMRESNSPVQLYLGRQKVDTGMLRVYIQTTFDRSEEPKKGPYAPSGRQQPYYARDDYRNSYQGRPRGNPYSTTPFLDEFARDLTALARSGKLDPVIGRRKEIDRAVRILARRGKNNPVLVGEPGVGKTAIVEGLAQLFTGEETFESLAGKRILSLEMGSVVAGTKYRGEFEERMKRIMREISQAHNIILFIDEVHTIIGAGGAEGALDASNLLKPALSRGELQCIGATTLTEYRRYFERDAALERRFQAILVEEPDYDSTVGILKGLQKRYEDHHKVLYTQEAVEAAVKLSGRYVTGRCMPDKAIDILDEAGAMRKLEQKVAPPEISTLEAEILHLSHEKTILVSSQDYEGAADIRDKVHDLRNSLEAAKEAWNRSSWDERSTVTEQDVRRVVAEVTGIPLNHLEEHESKRLLCIEQELHRAVIAQDDAVNRIASAIRRTRAGVSSPRRPQGSFIFLGPTGVGKTLLAKHLAVYLFGSEEALVRIDMSDFMEKHNISRLVGAPPGYIGYEEGGALTERIRRNPYRVILFDEIEKAHRDVFNLLLQVLEEGELKDNLGHTVNFRNTVIIMTSNAGVREISRDTQLGFGSGSGIMNIEEIRSAAMSELRRLFNPEFINRVDDVVVFHALNTKQVEAIFDIQTQELSARLAEQGFSLKIQKAARSLLVEKGWDPKYGARPMRRAIQKEIEDPLAMLLLEQNYSWGTEFTAAVRQGKIQIRATKGSLTKGNLTKGSLAGRCSLTKSETEAAKTL